MQRLLWAGSTFHYKLEGGCLPAADLPISVRPAAVQTAVRQLQNRVNRRTAEVEKCLHLQADVVTCGKSVAVRQRTPVIVFMPTVAAVKADSRLSWPMQVALLCNRYSCPTAGPS